MNCKWIYCLFFELFHSRTRKVSKYLMKLFEWTSSSEHFLGLQLITWSELKLLLNFALGFCAPSPCEQSLLSLFALSFILSFSVQSICICIFSPVYVYLNHYWLKHMYCKKGSACRVAPPLWMMTENLNLRWPNTVLARAFADAN